MARLPTLMAIPLFLVGCAPVPEMRPVMVQDGASTSGSTEEDDYLAGKRHLTAGELGLAIGRFRKAVARDRTDVKALNALAACYDRLNRFDLADRYYDKALAVAPEDAQTLNNAGVSQLMRGRPAEALVMLRRAGQAAPDDPQVQANLARAEEARAVAAASKPEPEERPNRIMRLSRNVWSLATKPQPVRTVSFVPAAPPRGDEPPLPLSAPRAAITSVELDAPAQTADLKVLNAVGRRGMAARMRGFLEAKGWSGGSIGDAARPSGDSRLTYHPTYETRARRLAALLPPGFRLQPDPHAGTGLVLVLGRNMIPFDQTLASRGAR
jgi:hypothetical protein